MAERLEPATVETLRSFAIGEGELGERGIFVPIEMIVALCDQALSSRSAALEEAKINAGQQAACIAGPGVASSRDSTSPAASAPSTSHSNAPFHVGVPNDDRKVLLKLKVALDGTIWDRADALLTWFHRIEEWCALAQGEQNAVSIGGKLPSMGVQHPDGAAPKED